MNLNLDYANKVMCKQTKQRVSRRHCMYTNLRQEERDKMRETRWREERERE